MVDLWAVLSESVNTAFALFARKLILSGQVIAIICMVGWRLDAKLGIPLWPARRRGLALLGDVVAAGATLAVVLFVAFVRDAAELGSQPELMRYAGECLAVFAALALLAAAIDQFHDRSGCFEVLATLLTGIVAIVLLDGLARALSGPLDEIGAVFVRTGTERPFHGLAALLFALLFVASIVRLIARGSAPVGPWDVFVVFSLVALSQGFLAFRGVSALFILAAGAAVAWMAGWRAQVALRKGRVRILFRRIVRSPTKAEAPRRFRQGAPHQLRVRRSLRTLSVNGFGTDSDVRTDPRRRSHCDSENLRRGRWDRFAASHCPIVSPSPRDRVPLGHVERKRAAPTPAGL
jgi:hypothetical protein